MKTTELLETRSIYDYSQEQYRQKELLKKLGYDLSSIKKLNNTARTIQRKQGPTQKINRRLIQAVADFLTGNCLSNINPEDYKNILDFGCGREEKGIKLLQEMLPSSHTFYGCEIGYSRQPHQIDFMELDNYPVKMDLTYASNVYNVQPTKPAMEEITRVMHSNLRKGGLLFANYPVGPRVIPKHSDRMFLRMLGYYFPLVVEVKREKFCSFNYSGTLAICRKEL
jgi:hypothetical protein